MRRYSAPVDSYHDSNKRHRPEHVGNDCVHYCVRDNSQRSHSESEDKVSLFLVCGPVTSHQNRFDTAIRRMNRFIFSRRISLVALGPTKTESFFFDAGTRAG